MRALLRRMFAQVKTSILKKSLKRLGALSLTFAVVVPIDWAKASTFDCVRFLTRTQATSDLAIKDSLATSFSRFHNETVDLEDVLAWASNLLLAKDKDRFIQQVEKQMRGAAINRARHSSGFMRRLWRDSGLPYWRFKFEPEFAEEMELFFGAIRTAFSRDVGDRVQWENATPQERLRLSMLFKARAKLVLFYEFKLYRNLLALLPPDAHPKLASEADLSVPGRRGPPIFATTLGASLFAEVRLNADFFWQTEQLGEISDADLDIAIDGYLTKNYINLMDDYYTTKPALVRLESLSIVALMGLGISFASYKFYPFIHSSPAPREPDLTISSPSQQINPDQPIELTFKQLQTAARKRTLSPEEQIVLDTLERYFREQGVKP